MAPAFSGRLHARIVILYRLLIQWHLKTLLRSAMRKLNLFKFVAHVITDYAVYTSNVQCHKGLTYLFN